MGVAVFFLCLFLIAFLLLLFCLFLRIFNIPKLYRKAVDGILCKLEGAGAVRSVFKFIFLDIGSVIDRNVSRTARTIVYCLGLSLIGILSYPLELKFITIYLLTFFICTAGLAIYSFLLDRFISVIPEGAAEEKRYKIKQAAIRLLALAVFASGCFWGAAVAAEHYKSGPEMEAESTYTRVSPPASAPVFTQAPASASLPRPD
jgi:hypothetical protein